ncbi:hypothetical protein [Polynucleobacter sp. AP-RePozz3-80-G7]|uniref:hypothetical protein n=1 Tax=Polynucleobacter sp. AP-RePozz3-80-G7 TaxID=2689105 RepID=UPI001C0D7D78|nr:hypothetical protein [Polynucleobacter sp. AP-RePozz3-80-G7]MBU3638752.1 hypothetical protein [Polynucleobacter sp. AP-RePozz3-80-G7]
MRYLKLILILLILNACSSANEISSKLNTIMSPNTIGIQKEFFEKTYGPAKRVLFDMTNQYEIGKCKINIQFDQKNSISSIELENLSKECSFNSKNIYLDGQANQLTYGDLASKGIWQAKFSCYESCGNASDPTYGIFVKTGHATIFIEYEATSSYSNEDSSRYQKASKGSNAVLDFFKNKYPKIEMNGWTPVPMTAAEYNQIWLEKFKDVPISSLKFGYKLQPQ